MPRGSRRPGTGPGATQPVDLNILPEQYLPRVLPSYVRIMWLAGVGLLVVAAALFVKGRFDQAQIRDLEAGISRMERQLDSGRTPQPDFIALRDELTQIEAALTAVQTVYPSATGYPDWPQVLGAILEYDQRRIELKELLQSGIEVSVIGLALTQEDVRNYATKLELSGVFERVLVQSMRDSTEALSTPPPLVPRTPAPGATTPAATGTPGGTGEPTVALTPTSPLSTTPTATRAFYDLYEIDDFEHKPIGTGEVQRRNFNPEGDRDRASFLGLANHTYCIRAIPESPVVDPYLAVKVGETLWENDNCQPAGVVPECPCPSGSSQAAVVVIEITTPYDQGVLVELTNKGQFGPDTWYTLEVVDMPTEPPDTGADVYEPDDVTPGLIAPGEQQLRTFAPSGDVDLVAFAVRAGRAYELWTYGLAGGADTVLAVSLLGAIYANDDASPGQGASRVTFTATGDGQAIASVSNKGLFGPQSVYWLALRETIPAPTSTLPAAATPTSAVSNTPTAAIACGDAFEPDDIVGHALAIGAVELHSFCPPGDVDRVVFTAKHGHRYRVETMELNPGVDTTVVVLLAGVTRTNNDRSYLDYSSLVEVVNSSGADAPAFVTVTNRGVFGADKTYKIRVLDLGVTDLFEPDDWSGVEILPSQPQSRIFEPAGDVDKVTFLAKPHTVYHIYTSALSPGVDTVLVLDTPVHLVNDNARAGVLESSIEFVNTASEFLRAVVTITNKGAYGPNQRYSITVAEMYPGDAYEVDDINGVPIGIGGSQARTFYPPGDVDRVYFSAQPTHRYAVYTEQLDPGVDTALFATMGAVQVANDNRAPGDLSSYLELWNDTAGVLQARIDVANNGQYGIDKRYVLAVRDLGNEGLDGYEPDMTLLRPIALDEVQRHTFFPSGDIDRVGLAIAAGVRYAVLTCGSDGLPALPIHSTDPFQPLALFCAPLAGDGDTFLVVSGPIRRCEPGACQSDNVPQGEFAVYGNSRVEFEATQNGIATITVFNRGSFYPNQVYFLRAHAIDPLPTWTPTRTHTPTWTPGAPPTPTVAPSATSTEAPTATSAAAPSDTPSAAPSATGVTPPYPMPTTTPGPPTPTETPGWGYSSVLERGGPVAESVDAIRFPAAALKPLCAPLPQATATAAEVRSISFTLLLRLKAGTP